MTYITKSSLPAALGVAEAVHVAEILRMAGPRVSQSFRT